MARYVTIPKQPITLIHPETGKVFKTEDPDNPGQFIEEEPWTFWDFIRRQILGDADKFGEGYDGLVAVMQIKEAFENAQTGEEVQLDDPTWKKICEAIDKPKNKWNMPLAGVQLLPYMDASKKAETKKKEKAKALKEKAAA